ncbi:hypothetical protein DFH27DRAFT_1725 [Peziza echinospora]|nr:hypothetical protein DFH27DRAFT_1725 [Peziza echinospora]
MADPPSAAAAALHAASTDFYTLLSLTAPYPPTALLPLPPPIPPTLLRKSYRRTSLIYHPDKNPSPDAAATFHLLTTAFDVLNDPAAKAAYDGALVARLRRKRKGEEMSSGRRKLKEELEEREKKANEKRDAEVDLKKELERLSAEGVALRRKREEALRRAEEEEAQEMEEEEALKAQRPASPPPLQHQQQNSSTSQSTAPQPSTDLDRTLRIRTKPLPSDITISTLFSPFGKISDTLSKPPKKPTALSTTLIVYSSLLSAHSAIEAFELGKLPAYVKDVKWAGGSEPDAVKPLIEQVRRGQVPPAASVSKVHLQAKPQSSNSSSTPPKFSFSAGKSTSGSQGQATSGAAAIGAEYENVTLMRLREAEKRRLEEEIRRKEAEEEQAERVSEDI